MQTPAGSNLTQETFLEFFDQYQQACDDVSQKLGQRRDVMKRAEEAGINRAAFLNARKLAEVSGDRRVSEFMALYSYMGHLGKPLTMEPIPAPPDPTITDKQRQKTYSDGYAAGRHGLERATYNKWAPGSLLYATFDDGWVEGRAVLEDARAKDIAAKEAKEPKPRGRPKGSRNKPKANGLGK